MRAVFENIKQRNRWESNPQGNYARRFSRPLPSPIGLRFRKIFFIQSGSGENRTRDGFAARTGLAIRLPNQHGNTSNLLTVAFQMNVPNLKPSEIRLEQLHFVIPYTVLTMQTSIKNSESGIRTRIGGIFKSLASADWDTSPPIKKPRVTVGLLGFCCRLKCGASISPNRERLLLTGDSY